MAEFLLVRSGSFWQKEVAPGAHAADAAEGNQMTAASAIQHITHKDIRISPLSHNPQLLSLAGYSDGAGRYQSRDRMERTVRRVTLFCEPQQG
jgi:hypothetical protein